MRYELTPNLTEIFKLWFIQKSSKINQSNGFILSWTWTIRFYVLRSFHEQIFHHKLSNQIAPFFHEHESIIFMSKNIFHEEIFHHKLSKFGPPNSLWIWILIKPLIRLSIGPPTEFLILSLSIWMQLLCKCRNENNQISPTRRVNKGRDIRTSKVHIRQHLYEPT